MNNLIKIQAFDVILKRFWSKKIENLKVILQIDNHFWTGDLLNWSSNSIVEEYIDGLGVIDKTLYYKDNSEFLKKIYIASDEYTKKIGYTISKIEDSRLIFNIINEIIDTIDFSGVESKIDDVLYNAVSLSNDVELPFLSLKNSEIKLVAIKRNDH
ncbi:hypothetical protein SAMN05421839_13923 [Halolactibacillus halophilus]|uniref:Uncharacterized protein n=1 Tax=Halolactibacillus halophilus TaxID=306540 RepID=A0A1I5S5I1_9BACI|nr:hypothetical protein [Halolactibacillus halophilus]GEM02774.1 hypothetical protein HHA03_23060 [Halolactibacillus halophilus]SFP65985.1 hypothetical protein SAMN05421839_13923 [Halolactibacillus halophilus]